MRGICVEKYGTDSKNVTSTDTKNGGEIITYVSLLSSKIPNEYKLYKFRR